MKIPYITREQMERVDELAIESGITLEFMMEKAGTILADYIIKELNPKNVLVYAGHGHNGGGGLVAARKLKKSGIDVSIVLSGVELKQMTKIQLARAKEFDVEIINEKIAEDVDLIIDALLGYSVVDNPREPYKTLISSINKHKANDITVISLDIPSGINATTGELYEPHVEADITFTLALPKTGLQNIPDVGKIILADIGIPKSIYEKIDVEVSENMFGDKPYIKA